VTRAIPSNRPAAAAPSPGQGYTAKQLPLPLSSPPHPQMRSPLSSVLPSWLPLLHCPGCYSFCCYGLAGPSAAAIMPDTRCDLPSPLPLPMLMRRCFSKQMTDRITLTNTEQKSITKKPKARPQGLSLIIFVILVTCHSQCVRQQQTAESLRDRVPHFFFTSARQQPGGEKEEGPSKLEETRVLPQKFFSPKKPVLNNPRPGATQPVTEKGRPPHPLRKHLKESKPNYYTKQKSISNNGLTTPGWGRHLRLGEKGPPPKTCKSQKSSKHRYGLLLPKKHLSSPPRAEALPPLASALCVCAVRRRTRRYM
jgi:hypothetical protein